ncbi:hypothetical protein ACH5RR_010554 [Cinchona calisaya]|uniref:DUF761 domain-containing protein n=1 Tax=Cinchona calisaya TaxID=153742 RepID=A0ABD3AJ89_9GENT
MSYLNLKKLLPARKAWRAFTIKVQTKLHKLHPSKTIKKPKNKKQKRTSKKISWWPSFSIQPRVQCKRRIKSHTHTHSSTYPSYHFQKRPSAVYIDQLFIEPAVSVAKEHLQQPVNSAICRPSTSTVKKPEPEVVDRRRKMAKEGTSKEEGKLNDSMHSADEMWESLVLASPQMNGINERAEEFIARFRAEMLLQERLAHHL